MYKVIDVFNKILRYLFVLILFLFPRKVCLLKQLC